MSRSWRARTRPSLDQAWHPFHHVRLERAMDQKVAAHPHALLIVALLARLAVFTRVRL